MDDGRDQIRYPFDLGFIALGLVATIVTLAFEEGSRGGGGDTTWILGLGTLATLLIAAGRVGASGRPRVIALALMMLFNIGFWVAFAGLSDGALALASHEHPFVLEGSLPWLGAVGAAALLVLALGSSWLWAGLARHGLEPQPPSKFALGFVLLALGCSSLGSGIEWNQGQGGVGTTGLAICVVMLVLAGLCLGPVGLAAAFALSPRGGAGPWIAAWSMSLVFARSLATWIDPLALGSSMNGPAFAGVLELCVALGFGAVLSALALAFLWRPLDQLTGAWLVDRGARGARLRQPQLADGWPRLVARPLVYRALSITALLLATGCGPSRPGEALAPSLEPRAPALRAPELSLPFHAAPIVDLVLPSPAPGERWRLVSADEDGWIRLWADGQLLAAWLAHPGGVTALALARDGIRPRAPRWFRSCSPSTLTRPGWRRACRASHPRLTPRFGCSGSATVTRGS